MGKARIRIRRREGKTCCYISNRVKGTFSLKDFAGVGEQTEGSGIFRTMPPLVNIREASPWRSLSGTMMPASYHQFYQYYAFAILHFVLMIENFSFLHLNYIPSCFFAYCWF